MKTARPLVRNRETALYLGIAMTLGGGLLLWDAWENRGAKRPWAMRLIGLFPP